VKRITLMTSFGRSAKKKDAEGHGVAAATAAAEAAAAAATAKAEADADEAAAAAATAAVAAAATAAAAAAAAAECPESPPPAGPCAGPASPSSSTKKVRRQKTLQVADGFDPEEDEDTEEDEDEDEASVEAVAASPTEAAWNAPPPEEEGRGGEGGGGGSPPRPETRRRASRSAAPARPRTSNPARGGQAALQPVRPRTRNPSREREGPAAAGAAAGAQAQVLDLEVWRQRRQKAKAQHRRQLRVAKLERGAAATAQTQATLRQSPTWARAVPSNLPAVPLQGGLSSLLLAADDRRLGLGPELRPESGGGRGGALALFKSSGGMRPLSPRYNVIDREVGDALLRPASRGGSRPVSRQGVSRQGTSRPVSRQGVPRQGGPVSRDRAVSRAGTPDLGMGSMGRPARHPVKKQRGAEQGKQRGAAGCRGAGAGAVEIKPLLSPGRGAYVGAAAGVGAGIAGGEPQARGATVLPKQNQRNQQNNQQHNQTPPLASMDVAWLVQQFGPISISPRPPPNSGGAGGGGGKGRGDGREGEGRGEGEGEGGEGEREGEGEGDGEGEEAEGAPGLERPRTRNPTRASQFEGWDEAAAVAAAYAPAEADVWAAADEPQVAARPGTPGGEGAEVAHSTLVSRARARPPASPRQSKHAASSARPQSRRGRRTCPTPAAVPSHRQGWQ
jgi:hypothetical protein